MVDKDLINADEMIEKFSITKRTLHRWSKTTLNFPKPFKVGRRLLWKRSEVEAYIESLESTKQK